MNRRAQTPEVSADETAAAEHPAGQAGGERPIEYRTGGRNEF